MLLQLKTIGLGDVNFVIINSKDEAAHLSRHLLHNVTNGTGVEVYQETQESPIWSSVLKAKRDDILIYDRCGRLTYHLSYPMSILHPNRPIVHASVLSTYFDTPCGSVCSQVVPDQGPTTATAAYLETPCTVSDMSTITPDITETMTQVSSPTTELNELKLFEVTDSEYDNHTEVNGSSLVSSDDEDKRANVTTLEVSDSDVIDKDLIWLSSPWSIFEFFIRNQLNNTEINVTGTEYYSTVTEPYATDLVSGDWQSTSTQAATSSAAAMFTPGPMVTINDCQANDCRAFSTDSLLKARLCCLGTPSAGPTSPGCHGYSRESCNQMLPMVKCCLRNFSRLLSDFFGSRKKKKELPPPP
ncbi:Selenoprotein Pa [Halotydeus destructor]|nr:Selenoprotein Pa [Halotydeus destructor]